MSGFKLTCCSTADRTKEFFDSRDIAYVCFHWLDGGVDHLDDLYQSISPDEFFAKIKAGAQPTTSQVTVGEFLEFWKPFLEAGQDVLHVSLSSGISGEYESACLAASELAKVYPNNLVMVVDSLGASSGYGMLVDYLADMRDAGKSLDECYEWALENRLKVHHWFFSTDLTSYIRGGRVSKVSGFFGTALKICPVLNVDNHGKLIPRDKIRTSKAAAADVVKHMVEFAQNGTAYEGKCMLSMSACRKDAEYVVSLIEDQFPALVGKVEINNIGTVIGAHTGPGTVALFFMGTERTD